MISLLVILVIVALAVIVLQKVLLGAVKVNVRIVPIVPLGIGLVIGLILFMFPLFKLTLNEAILLGFAAGGFASVANSYLKK
ncbi:MAG: hypothetical protein WC484_07070 [Candidatus Omnitrophota bacterium]|jgi:hypothetical protein